MKGKRIRKKGKIEFSRYFQKLKEGEKVAVNVEKSVDFNFPKRLQGRTGVVEGSRGNVKLIKIKDQNKEKKFLIHPIHLKKIQ